MVSSHASALEGFRGEGLGLVTLLAFSEHWHMALEGFRGEGLGLVIGTETQNTIVTIGTESQNTITIIGTTSQNTIIMIGTATQNTLTSDKCRLRAPQCVLVKALHKRDLLRCQKRPTTVLTSVVCVLHTPGPLLLF